MNEELDKLYNEFILKVKEQVAKASAELENHKLLIMQINKDKAIVGQQMQEIERMKKDIEQREGDLQRGIELNRQKSATLDLKEKKVNNAMERAKTSLINLGLE